MSQTPPAFNKEKLDKVLALADSAHDGEALAALRAARSMLKSNGVDLATVLGGMVRPSQQTGVAGLSRVAPPPDIVTALQREIIQLQQKNNQLQASLREQQRETAHWRRAAEDKARIQAKTAEESERWRQLAEQTTNKLWDIVREIEEEGRKDGAASSTAKL